MTHSVFTYLTMTVGQREGRSFLLDPGVKNFIGRGPECRVVLNDPLCSRVHAVLEERNGSWHVLDQSTNGTLLDGEPVEDAPLADGHVLRIGSTELAFRQTEESPTLAAPLDPGMTQTLVRDTPVSEHDTSEIALAALQDSPEAQDLLMVHQLSVRLLSSQPLETALRDTLELLRERTEASSAAFLWANEDGRLRTKLTVPADALGRPLLSESICQMVTGAGRAVWIANQQARGGSGGAQHDADVLYVPLVHENRVLGALQVYLRDGHFRQSHFDFAISAANIAGRALARACGEARLEREVDESRKVLGVGEELIGESAAIEQIKSQILQAASGGCVLLRGERGVGKRSIAGLLHRHSPRADRPMVSFACGKTDDGESTLAIDSRPWKQADMGTVYVHDVSQLDNAGQQLLLHLIEGHPIRFADAAGEEVELDICFIAGTTSDLRRRVRQGDFSSELYQHLSQQELHIPPLRDRREDVPPLIEHFLAGLASHHGRGPLSLSDAAREKLLAFDWPGNVGELRNVLDTAATVADAEQIEADDLRLSSAGSGQQWESLRIDHWERKLIVAALKQTGGNVPEAAKLLGIGRATLYRKIDDYGIPR